MCQSAITGCSAGGAAGSGPLIIVYRRTVPAAGAPSSWQAAGTSCDPNAVPANTGPATAAAPLPPPKPVLTMGMILDAFHATPFAVPQVSAQPVGDATLVRLPVFLQLQWPAAGYQPGEVEPIDPGRMLGYTVKIKPVLNSAAYAFGDGASIGPTQDLGGPYPNGTITHPYPRAGVYTTSITAVYGGEVSVNGGPFVPITGTATRTSPGHAITVKTAKNQLVR